MSVGHEKQWSYLQISLCLQQNPLNLYSKPLTHEVQECLFDQIYLTVTEYGWHGFKL